MVIVGVCKQRSKNFIESYTSMHRGIIHLSCDHVATVSSVIRFLKNVEPWIGLR